MSAASPPSPRPLLWSRALAQIFILITLALIPAIVSGLLQVTVNKEEPLNPGEVRVATAVSWGAKAIWVDARDAKRFEQDHVPNAVRLRVEEWEALVPSFLDAWDEDKMVVVYCDGGQCDASHAVADRLEKELQIRDVFVLQGGFPAWQRARP